MNDVNKPYLDKEFKELAEKVGLLTPAYHTDDGTRFYIDRRLQLFAKELVEQIRQQTAKECVSSMKRIYKEKGRMNIFLDEGIDRVEEHFGVE
jgi:hypothetical protein